MFAMTLPPEPRTVRFLRVEAAVVLISIAMLMYEILQTITLSLQTLERNAFLVISLCLMGLGSGGSLATWLGAKKSHSTPSALWWSAIAFGVSSVIAAIASSWTLSLPLLIALGFIPYVPVGVFLAYIFKSWPDRSNRSYFFNLIGSGLGCIGLVWIVNGTGDAELIILVIAAVALLAAFLIGTLEPGRRVLAPVLMVIAIAALIPFRQSLFGYRPARDKGMGAIIDDSRIESEIVWSKWGYLGRLDVLKPGDGIENFRSGGDNIRTILDEGCEPRFLFASGGNWTKAVDFDGNASYRQRFANNSRHAIPYRLTDDPDVLNIGFGGGVDIFLALFHGAKSVVGVEINPLMIEAGRTYLRGYFDDFYNDPRVAIVEMDGRTYVRNASRKFDVVSLTAVDTGELLHSNAHVLLENYLYTQEAFDEYFDVLEDDGYLYVSRPKLQIMRIMASAVSTMRRSGIKNPEEHFAVIGQDKPDGGPWRSVLIAKKPLTAKEKNTILGQYKKVGYLPGSVSVDEWYKQFFDAVSSDMESEYIAALPINFSPVWDDRPFFYEFGRSVRDSEAVRLLLNVLLWVTLIAAALILLPLFGLRSNGSGVRRPWLGVMGYFAAIGAGFMFIEICLIQKLVLFLGHPSYSVTVTLFSILIFSGLGSVVSQKLDTRRMTAAFVIWGPIIVAAIFYATALGAVLLRVHTDSLAVRSITAALLLAPGSFFMGMPFPTMIGLLGDRDQILIPWAWAVNAFTSVAASVLTVLFAMQFGFTTVMYLGAVFYLVSLLFYLARIRTQID
jgi:spermidine synthase